MPPWVCPISGQLKEKLFLNAAAVQVNIGSEDKLEGSEFSVML